MIAISLQSGSNGNCLYVESNGKSLLFDAGIRAIEAERRLALYGRDIRNIDGLIISHDHADHVRHAGVYQRRFGIPLFITPRTLQKAEASHRLGRLQDVHHFFSGGSFSFDNLTVETLPSPHDGADGSLFVVSSETKRLGIFTDLGHVFEQLYAVTASLDAVFLESNYDHSMLARGPYPSFLKQRIRGPEGHLSNRESAELLRECKNLKWACLAHLSKNNNTPECALRTHRDILGDSMALFTASRYMPTSIMSI
jgi:phosphoribosyl 1,2-cyclic phosphodiesterase